MKKSLLVLGVVISLMVAAHPGAFAGDDDDGGSSGLTGNFELLEKGLTFATYEDKLSGLLVIDLGDDLLVGIPPISSEPIKCTQGGRELRAFPLEKTDGPFGPSGVHIEFENSEEDNDDEDNSQEAAEFCREIRQAFVRILKEDPSAVDAIKTIHFLGILMSQIYPEDRALFDLWWDVVQIQVALDEPPDPCKETPCDPTKCKGCPDPPPDPPGPPPPMSENEWIINVCDVKLSVTGCFTLLGCDQLEFEFTQNDCRSTCYNAYEKCVRECRQGGPEQGKPGDPISPAPEPEPSPPT